MLPVVESQFDMLWYLLKQHKADVLAKNGQGETILHICARNIKCSVEIIGKSTSSYFVTIHYVLVYFH